jgi:lysozyme
MLALAACSQRPADACRRKPRPNGPFAPGNEGIDLSHHNGRVNWDALGSAPIDFVYLKATEGATGRIPGSRKTGWQASQQGWHVGAYHFYLLCRNGGCAGGEFHPIGGSA